ncbi:hypothetical protein F4809DRAFT_594616 [Biscogniauxia mediterranea]|nr:hypothetical protein F4809DRAFT_594616 [Biscogniauxia mediterranea]
MGFFFVFFFSSFAFLHLVALELALLSKLGVFFFLPPPSFSTLANNVLIIFFFSISVIIMRISLRVYTEVFLEEIPSYGSLYIYIYI